MDYWDAGGLLHDQRVVTSSENRTLWSSEWAMLKGLAGEFDMTTRNNVGGALWMCYDTNKEIWYVDSSHKEFLDQSFSRDNMIGVVSFGLYCGKEFHEQFLMAPQGWEHISNHLYWQPQDIIFFAWAAKRWIGYLGLPFLCLNIIYACWALSKCGSGELSTDSWLLSFVRMQGGKHRSWLLQKTWDWCEKIIPKRLAKGLGVEKLEFNHWRTIFSMYFKDPDHPNNVLCRKIWP